MIIGLVGFECESPNKGCEALTYSFLSLINEYAMIKKIDIQVYVFTQFSLGKIPDKYPSFLFSAIPLKIKDIKCKFIKALIKCDIIFDVTMGDSFSDLYSLDYFNYLIKEKMYASYFTRRYILLPQTYGPFNHKSSFKKAIKILKRADKIYCRDELSQKLLKDKVGITNSELASDMAFMLPYDKNQYSSLVDYDVCNIGINISGLLFKGGFNSDNQFNLKLNYRNYIYDILNFLKNKTNYCVHLIPHVIDTRTNASDDDYKTIINLGKLFPWVNVAPPFETPIDAKSFISNMDIFIGSRMHSTIAAFSSGVTTIPVSYSRKFEGLYESLSYPYTINARLEDNKSALVKMISYIESPHVLKEAQSKSLIIVEHKNQQFRRSIFNLLDEIKP